MNHYIIFDILSIIVAIISVFGLLAGIKAKNLIAVAFAILSVGTFGFFGFASLINHLSQTTGNLSLAIALFSHPFIDCQVVIMVF